MISRGMQWLVLAGLSLPGFPGPADSAPPPAGAALDPAPSTAAPGDSLPSGVDPSLPSPEPYFNLVVRREPAIEKETPGFDLDAPRLLLTHPAQFYPLIRTTQPARFHSSILGADKGAFAGMALGFLGMETGLWEERTAWYLMGAGAALGAVWGGTLGSENASIRLRVEPDR